MTLLRDLAAVVLDLGEKIHAGVEPFVRGSGDDEVVGAVFGEQPQLRQSAIGAALPVSRPQASRPQGGEGGHQAIDGLEDDEPLADRDQVLEVVADLLR